MRSALVLLVVPAFPGLALGQAGPSVCRQGLLADADADAGITLTWTSVEGPTAYQVVVRPAGGDATPLAPQVPPSTTVFTYPDAVPGRAYEFTVVPMRAPGEQMPMFCPVTVTAIPLFPSPLVSALAVPGLVGAFVLLRRRG